MKTAARLLGVERYEILYFFFGEAVESKRFVDIITKWRGTSPDFENHLAWTNIYRRLLDEYKKDNQLPNTKYIIFCPTKMVLQGRGNLPRNTPPLRPRHLSVALGLQTDSPRRLRSHTQPENESSFAGLTAPSKRPTSKRARATETADNEDGDEDNNKGDENASKPEEVEPESGRRQASHLKSASPRSPGTHMEFGDEGKEDNNSMFPMHSYQPPSSDDLYASLDILHPPNEPQVNKEKSKQKVQHA